MTRGGRDGSEVVGAGRCGGGRVRGRAGRDGAVGGVAGARGEAERIGDGPGVVLLGLPADVGGRDAATRVAGRPLRAAPRDDRLTGRLWAVVGLGGTVGLRGRLHRGTRRGRDRRGGHRGHGDVGGHGDVQRGRTL